MAPQTRPFIGVNADYLPPTKNAIAQVRLNVGYLDAIVTAGGMPVLLPPLGKEVDLDAFLDRLDGFVLTGGLDLDPRRHGLPPHHALHLMAERRDLSDRRLVRSLLERRLPLLGIGLGMQQINVALGGTLLMHLPEDLPRTMPHYDASGGTASPYRAARAGHAHGRNLWRAAKSASTARIIRRCARSAPGMRIGALAPDGVIEAIEATDANWFCVGVQWHPESESSSALDSQLFECFMQACVQQAHSLQAAA